MKTKNQLTVIAEPGKQELFLKREFDAPRDLVYAAFSDPYILTQWSAPFDMKMKIDKYDNKAGGQYRFLYIDAKGNEFAFNGVIHEIVPEERVIRTYEFEGLPEKGHVLMEVLMFESLPNDRTRMVTQQVFRSVADRDGMVQSGMEHGATDSYNKLDTALEKMTR